MQNESGEEAEDSNVFNFISQLRQEALYISFEKNLLQELNEKVQKKTYGLLESTWITTKKRLSLVPQKEFTLQNVQEIISVGSMQFIKAKEVVGFQNSGKIGALLQILRTQPEQLAQWLIIGEQLNDEQTHLTILQSVVTGLYASLIFPEDINYMLVLLHELAKYQLLRSEKPQRALKQRSNSFECLYFMFHEVLLPAKYFLSGTFEVSILRLLTIDYYLDIDPDKSEMRFHQEDSISALFNDFSEYRNAVVRKLAEVTNFFLSGLKDNSLSFPKPLTWLVYQIKKFICDSFNEREANAVVTELIFTMFICPAIVNPLQYGICDVQITAISRHNLMQVGQLIQNLAFIKHETPDSRVLDIYKLIDKEVLVQLLDELFSEIKHSDVPPIDVNPYIFRGIAFFTEHEIRTLVTFLQRVHGEVTQKEIHKRNPILTDSIIEEIATLSLASSDNSVSKQNKLSNGHGDNSRKSPNLLSLVTRSSSKLPEEVQTVNNVALIFSIRTDSIEPVGMLSEEAIMKKNFVSVDLYAKNNDTIDELQKNTTDENKRSNYSFQDEGSIENTSDNLEAISEGASNHSVASSLEMENEDQNDNYSDMMSANVSGRGTPNISGRDTPSSQVNENEDRAPSEVRQADNTQPQQQSQLSRQIRSEIDDKFCKFEIKLPGPGRDETTSLISETWSTDVLASDNETIDATDSRVEQQCYSLIDQPIAEIPMNHMLDISETQSESAWSTDVMTSDTERLIEIDNDDTGSIAQSDDTNSIAPSDDTRSETDENLTPGSRRLSNSSSSFMNQSNLILNHHQEMKRLESKIEQNVNSKTQFAERNGRRDSKPNAIMKSYSSERNNLTYIEMNSHVKNNQTSSSSFASQKTVQKTISKDATNTNGLDKRFSVDSGTNEIPLTYINQSRRKFENGSNEILLSNCSLNSSSSGSSSNSLENKNNNESGGKWENKQWLDSSQSSLNVTSTPSESTSELSVLSVTNFVSPVSVMNKKSVVPNTRAIKSSSSTGAIPKSISFDISADKGDKYLDVDHKSKRGGFFGKLRILRYRRGKSFRNADDLRMENEEECSSNSFRTQSSQTKLSQSIDSSDQILEKYRTKPFEENNSCKVNEETAKSSRVRQISEGTIVSNQGSNTFRDIKNKLRVALSCSTAQLPGDIKIPGIPLKSKIEAILQTELGKSRKLRQWSNVARITETLKCVQFLTEKNCKKLIKSMKNDVSNRYIYTHYVVSSRRDLLVSVAYLDGLQEQMSYEKELCDEYLATLYVDDFLRHKETEMSIFCDEFRQLNLSDEKCDILDNFFSQLYSDMKSNVIWNEILKERKSTIKMALQRHIISRVYENALYPNGDGDRDRDRVLYEHIEKLSSIITPEHKYLMIRKLFLRECPWQPAQDALNAMSAFRTPRDKVNCVVHCAKSIMDLLAMAQNGSTTADDFTPVLVFVIVKSNPVNLLSTIQFVNSFYQNQLCGEEQYWWIQFCAAVEFIKTMDYSD